MFAGMKTILFQISNGLFLLRIRAEGQLIGQQKFSVLH